MENIIFKQAN